MPTFFISLSFASIREMDKVCGIDFAKQSAYILTSNSSSIFDYDLFLLIGKTKHKC